MDYEGFMNICKTACHERQACKVGYEQLLQSEDVGSILATMYHNWADVWGSKFADVVANRIVEVFDGLEDEFHAEGFYVNEETTRGRVIVANPAKPLRFDGKAEVYIFSKAHVMAFGECKVYCRDAESEIELYDNAYGKIMKGKVWAHNWSMVESHQECTCYNATSILASEGVLYDNGHRRLDLGKDVTVIKGK